MSTQEKFILETTGSKTTGSISSKPDSVKTEFTKSKLSKPGSNTTGSISSKPDSVKTDFAKSKLSKPDSKESDSEKPKPEKANTMKAKSEKTNPEDSDSKMPDSEETILEVETKISDDVVLEDMNKLITKHVIGGMGVGLIPIPIVDFVALTGLQLNLIKKISNAYDIPFSKDKVKNIIGALVGGGIPLPVGHALASIGKAVPGIGPLAGAIAMPITSGALTYAIGKVFLQHFASGGTLLDMDPKKLKAYYYEMFEEGKKISVSLHKDKKS
ncbi:GTPase domain-containing protein [Candidatus Magnetomorum sp. HK-1]|nr:GTPase domain-containing protein [Candidatus Magnetomorum sp. HK-1]